LNKQNANRYKYQGMKSITYHSINHKIDILTKWSGSHYYFVRAAGCHETNSGCSYPDFPYRLSRYDRERLQIRS